MPLSVLMLFVQTLTAHVKLITPYVFVFFLVSDVFLGRESSLMHNHGVTAKNLDGSETRKLRVKKVSTCSKNIQPTAALAGRCCSRLYSRPYCH